MSEESETRGVLPTILQQWADARTQLSKAVQTFVSATALLESTCTPFAMKSYPGLMVVIENNFETIENDKLDLRRAHAALKRRRNSYISPINMLPSELLAYIFKFTVAPHPPYEPPKGYDERNLSQVCSRWRQIALEVCPAWPLVSLNYNTSEDNMRTMDIRLYDVNSHETQVLVHRPPDIGYAQYVRTALDTISPYIRQLNALYVAAGDIEQLQLFLDIWLEKGILGSITELDLSVNTAALIFPDTSSELSDRLYQSLRHVGGLNLRSVGLNWSSVAFDRLTSMRLADLPPVCCPSLAQLARMLSTCPGLQYLWLERITTPTSLDVVAPEPVELEDLDMLSLAEVDFAGVFSIISPMRCNLTLDLQGAIDDIDALASLHSFISRFNISQLTLSLSGTRLDATLGHLLHSAIDSNPELGRLELKNMDLRDSELNALSSHPLALSHHLPPSALVGTTACQMRTLGLWYCTIHTGVETFHNAVSTLPWRRMFLWGCKHLLAAQGVNVTETTESITTVSEFGIRLKELMPGPVDIY